MNEPHYALVAARKAVGDTAPNRPGLGPKPRLFNPTLVALTVWVADQLTAQLADRPRDFEAVLKVARTVDRPGALTQAQWEWLRSLQSELGSPNDDAAGTTTVTQALAHEAVECHVNTPCGKGLRAAASIAAAKLGDSFIDKLELELARLDAVSAIAREGQVSPAPKVVETIWRGTTGPKTTHYVVRLEDGTFGLLAKTKQRWHWSVGTREDIVATLPEAQFQEGVAAVLEGPRAANQVRSAKSSTIERHVVLDQPLIALSVDSLGRAWLCTENMVSTWGDHPVPKPLASRPRHIAGLSRTTWGGISWGREGITEWVKGKPILVSDEVVDGAWPCMTKVAWLTKGRLVLGGTPLEKLRAKAIIPASDSFAVLTETETALVRPNREIAGRWRVTGDEGVSTFLGNRFAIWSRGTKHKTVTILDSDNPEPAFTLTTKRGSISRVAFAKNHIAVGYDLDRAVAFFGHDGRSTSSKPLTQRRCIHWCVGRRWRGTETAHSKVRAVGCLRRHGQERSLARHASRLRELRVTTQSKVLAADAVSGTVVA